MLHLAQPQNICTNNQWNKKIAFVSIFSQPAMQVAST